MADAAEAAPAVRITSLAYDELVTGKDLREEIERAFGYDGPGLLTVSGVPGLAEARARLLPLARAFATLPDATKRKYEHARSFYSIGWSHGREKLQGRPDVAKGSYYANPLHDAPFSDPADIAKYPAFAEPNVWPTEELPELRGAFMHAGQLIHAVGCLVASQCDRFVSERLQDRYPPQRISQLLRSSRCCKARLLHYFATKGTDAQSAPRAHHELAKLPPADGAAADGISADDDAFSNWCGWHNDHGTLTGLLPAMYIGADGAAEMECPDAAAGLYVRSRCGRLIHVRIPPTQPPAVPLPLPSEPTPLLSPSLPLILPITPPSPHFPPSPHLPLSPSPPLALPPPPPRLPINPPTLIP